ncbi:class I SAM-dependent methyltransferase [Buchananella felis]|uniref:class I SAM-dependent methyltransferase n=1 Tax=Buchananella felis TaxID=3231492 RepID=UPI0035278AEC
MLVLSRDNRVILSTPVEQNAYDLTAKYYADRHFSDIENDTPIVSRVMHEWGRFNTGLPSVLDVGCGVGTNLRMFSNLGCAVTGIDTSEEMLRYARLIAPESTLYKLDVREVHRIKEQFDIVFAKALIHLFPYEESFEIGRALINKLRPHGIFYVTTTMHEIHKESFEKKDDYPGAPLRFRSRWDYPCWRLWLEDLGVELLTEWSNVDPRSNKFWVNAILKV